MKNRVPWNLAGLMGHLQPGSSDAAAAAAAAAAASGLPHPFPHPSHYPTPNPSYPHLLQDPWVSMPHPTSSIVPEISSGHPGPDYKVEPQHLNFYQHSPHGLATPPGGASALPSVLAESTGSDALPFGSSVAIETQDMMPSLHNYFDDDNPVTAWSESGPVVGSLASTSTSVTSTITSTQPTPMPLMQQQHEQHHAGYSGASEFALGRPSSYTDRKKKIIKEWTKSSTTESPSSSSVATSTTTTTTTSVESVIRSAAYTPGSSSDFVYAANAYTKEEANNYVYGHYAAAYHEAYHASVAGPAAMGGVASTSKKERRRRNAASNASNASDSSISQGLTRDERRALALRLPISVQEVINLPMDEFNDLLSKHEMSEEQLTLCRDIRRRGKNKVAARNCRKRKIDQIKQLEDDVARIRGRKNELVAQHEKLVAQRNHWTDLVKRLHDHVLRDLGHDPQLWQLQMDANRQVHILPRSHDNEHNQVQRPYHYAPSVGPPVMEHPMGPS